MEKTILIKTLTELSDLEAYLEDKDFVSFDTETTGVEKESEIIGFSVCADIEVGYYVILASWDTAQQKLVYLETRESAKSFLAKLTKKKLIMQNGGFDCAMVLHNFGIDLMPSLNTDTLLSGHLLNENRSNGLKERAVALYGEDQRQEQNEMKASVTKNGGMLTKSCYELYKADADLIGHYGAKDAILTLKIFYEDVANLYDEKLDKFYYEDETIPLYKGPTYDMNTTGLCIDPDKLSKLKSELEAECLSTKSFIYKEITPYVEEKYPGTGKTNVFNIGAGQQLAWLLFDKLGNEFTTLTNGGKELCEKMGWPVPYAPMAKREFVRQCTENYGMVYVKESVDLKTGKKSRPKKIANPWQYMTTGPATQEKYAKKYKWMAKFIEYKKSLKLLNTYVEGIQSRMKYNVIRPNFLQFGTTSGRYSCKNPNFQNLPRDDKRIKACIIARKGKVFVGADYSQLEPRVFASFSGDERLLNCFKNGDDFYSVIGMEVFEKFDCTLKKSDKNSFANKYPRLRDISKVVGLSATYGTTAYKMASAIGKSQDEAQEVIDSYFRRFPSVRKFMLDTHEEVKTNGYVVNLFGRPRRMPQALLIRQKYRNTKHEDLPYEIRNILNLAVNHKIQSTGASIMNRAAVACWMTLQEFRRVDPLWAEVKIVMQVHDELILEGPESLAEDMVVVLKDAMENTVVLPGVDLIATPIIAHNIADLKG